MPKDNHMQNIIARKNGVLLILAVLGLILLKSLHSIWSVHNPQESHFVKGIMSDSTNQQGASQEVEQPPSQGAGQQVEQPQDMSHDIDVHCISEPLYHNPVKVPAPDSYHRLVHLDLKGAPPKIEYLMQVIPVFAKLGATGLLVEYEDMFPYSGPIDLLNQPDAYRLSDIYLLQQVAKDNHLEFIPLIQSFGHFEFVLKYERFATLREVPSYAQSLCPSKPESLEVLKLMIDQIMVAHPDLNFLHIGGDEVQHLGYCEDCQRRIITEFNGSKDRLFLSHIVSVLTYIRQKYPHVQVIMWEDMLRHISLDVLQEFKLGDLVEPMVWNYYWNTHLFHNNVSPDVWHKYGSVFNNIWAATAFKGATGVAQYYTDITMHIGNHHLWVDESNQQFPPGVNFRGYALTGWQRYNHFSVLCELLPSGLPSLAFCLQTLIHGGFSEQIHSDISKALGFMTPIELSMQSEDHLKTNKALDNTGNFPGSSIYAGIEALMNLEYSKDMQRLQGTHKSRMEGWMTEYQLEYNKIDQQTIDTINTMAIKLLAKLEIIKEKMEIALPEVYGERTVQEWMMTRIYPMIKTLGEIRDKSQIYMTKT